MSRTPSGWPNGTQHGLLSGSFIPPRDQREVRELTRYRTSLVQERARAVNRLQNYLGRDQYQAGGCGHRHPGRVGARNVGGAAGPTERCRAAGRTGARATQGEASWPGAGGHPAGPSPLSLAGASGPHRPAGRSHRASNARDRGAPAA